MLLVSCEENHQKGSTSWPLAVCCVYACVWVCVCVCVCVHVCMLMCVVSNTTICKTVSFHSVYFYTFAMTRQILATKDGCLDRQSSHCVGSTRNLAAWNILHVHFTARVYIKVYVRICTCVCVWSLAHDSKQKSKTQSWQQPAGKENVYILNFC